MKTDRNSQFDAVYQYLADHTIPTDKGPAVSFLLPKKPEMRRRILSREKGYKRVNSDDIIENVLQYRETLPYVRRAKKKVEHFKRQEGRQRIKRQLASEGTLKDRLVIFIRTRCDAYVNRRVKEIQKHELS